MTEELNDRLLGHTLELVQVRSVSGNEAAIVRVVREMAPAGGAYELVDDEDTCSVYLPAKRRPGAPLVLVAGHLDTVPLAGSAPGRREGDVVHGRGAADQKGGIAVMLELMALGAMGALPSDLDIGFVFFGREEVGVSALAPCLKRNPELGEAALAIVTEPTGNAVEAGCVGNIVARVVVRGEAAHSARPWLGRNAIHEAVQTFAPIADLPVRDVELDGLIYREAVSLTAITGGAAANVIPDLVEATVNMRYAPDRSATAAEAWLHELVPSCGNVRLEVQSNARAARPSLASPFVQRLIAACDLPVRPKQAWTPVAEFAAAGIDAVNLGPGDPSLAHRDDERVTGAALARCIDVLRAFITGPDGAGPRGVPSASWA